EDAERDPLAIGRAVVAQDALAEAIDERTLDLGVGREEVMDDLVARHRRGAVPAEAFERRRLTGADPSGDGDRERARDAAVGVGVGGAGLVGLLLLGCVRFRLLLGLGLWLDRRLGRLLDLSLRYLDLSLRYSFDLRLRDLRVVEHVHRRGGGERLLRELQ